VFVESRSNKVAKEIPFVNYKKFKFDENGVPVLSAKDIEGFASEVLNWFDDDLLSTPKKVSILKIIDKFSIEYDVRLIPNIDLGETEAGDQILGKCLPNKRTIYISSILLDEDIRLPFTTAHELGHLLLHRGLRLKGSIDPNIIEDTERDLNTGKKKLKTPRDFLEWQAKCFAANLLLPKKSFCKAFVDIQNKMGIRRNVGSIYINSASSILIFGEIRYHLASIFGVSESCVEYRLDNLNIIVDERDKNISRI
jgi:Zn-dependent peptidase ImmA (M78 family)